MPSRAHQFIAELIARKMYLDGYEVVSFDGITDTERVKLKIPPKILRHRPDLIGIDKDRNICIGEAKTSHDFGSHTLEQIEDFTSVGLKLYFGMPDSSKDKFAKICSSGDVKEDKIHIISVPDRLLPESNDG